MKYLSLFSGIGGFELGIQQAHEIYNLGRTTSTSDTTNGRHQSVFDDSNGDGGRSNPDCIGFSEIDKYATQVYQQHFPNHKNYGDITKINAEELPNFDILVGGFPCQAFSIAGLRRGFEEARGTLFFDIARILSAKQPRLFLLEKVKGLLSHDDGRTFRTIISTLDELGYDLQWQVLNSKNHGVPQNRERVYIAGHLRGTPRPEVFPIGSGDQEYIREADEQRSASTLTGRSAGGQNRRGNYIIHNVYGGFGEGVRKFTDYSPTIRTAAGGGHIPAVVDGMKVRRLTPVECERLQSFPDGWTEGVSDTQRYKMLGNAVTTNVIRDIMIKLL
jgi:DNA (cytosine-5)-methyltransferase 1